MNGKTGEIATTCMLVHTAYLEVERPTRQSLEAVVLVYAFAQPIVTHKSLSVPISQSVGVDKILRKVWHTIQSYILENKFSFQV